MSKWKNVFNDKQVLPKMQEALRLVESVSVEGLQADDLASYQRLLKGMKVLVSRFENIDPELYHPNFWANLGQWADNIKANTNNFIQTKQTAHLQNANNTLDEVVNTIRPLDGYGSSKQVKAVTEAAESFGEKMVEEVERVKKSTAETESDLKGLAKTITQEKSRLDQLGQTIDQQKVRLDQSIAAYQKQFSDAEAVRSQNFVNESKKNADEFQKQKKVFEDEYKKTQDVHKQKLDQYFEAAKKETEIYFDFLKKREEEVDRIFGAIGSGAFAGHFKNTADQERRSANLFRWIALGLMVVMVILSGITFIYSFTKGDLGWHIFLFRFGASVIFLIPAAYAAQEASKHLEREKRTRKMHIELASLDSYLVLLPEEKRDEIKARLTERFFGCEEPVDKKDESVTKHALFDLVSTVLKNLTKGH